MAMNTAPRAKPKSQAKPVSVSLTILPRLLRLVGRHRGWVQGATYFGGDIPSGTPNRRSGWL